MDASFPLSPAPPPERDHMRITVFVLFNFALRYALIAVNRGVYTDGILQITQFQRTDSFWPPLYTAAVWLMGWFGAEPVWAGRFLSCIAASLVVIPLWVVARRWGGRRTALFAALLYTCAPLALRWSVRVMTDMPFLVLFQSASALLLIRWADERRGGARGLAWATVLAVAATLTRYQGLMLAPVVAWELAMALHRREEGSRWALAAQVLWLALPAWLAWQRFGHVGQVLERQGSTGWESLLNYVYTFQMFVFIIPYVLTLPVVCFLVVGLVGGPLRAKTSRPPMRRFLLYITLAVLIAQSLFQSFQSRYLLPLLPLALTAAGAGMARFHGRFFRTRRWIFILVVGITLAVSLGFAVSSVFLQRGAFADIYEAGRFLRDAGVPASTPVYSNEIYKPGMAGIKMGFAAEHEVRLIPELDADSRETMPPGSIVALHSAYGGPAAHRAMAARLAQRYRLRPLPGGAFYSSLVPLLPDIMEEPGTHQNPLAWLLRYRPQHFTTRLYMVEPVGR